MTARLATAGMADGMTPCGQTGIARRLGSAAGLMTYGLTAGTFGPAATGPAAAA
jgi:hypothetical protein